MIDIEVLKGEHFRTPNKFDKYDDPYDNLIYAILYQAMCDCRVYYDNDKHTFIRDKSNVIEWLDTTGRDLYEYLKHRPLKGVKAETDRKRRQYARRRNPNTGKFYDVI